MALLTNGYGSPKSSEDEEYKVHSTPAFAAKAFRKCTICGQLFTELAFQEHYAFELAKEEERQRAGESQQQIEKAQRVAEENAGKILSTLESLTAATTLNDIRRAVSEFYNTSRSLFASEEADQALWTDCQQAYSILLKEIPAIDEQSGELVFNFQNEVILCIPQSAAQAPWVEKFIQAQQGKATTGQVNITDRNQASLLTATIRIPIVCVDATSVLYANQVDKEKTVLALQQEQGRLTAESNHLEHNKEQLLAVKNSLENDVNALRKQIQAMDQSIQELTNSRRATLGQCSALLSRHTRAKQLIGESLQ